MLFSESLLGLEDDMVQILGERERSLFREQGFLILPNFVSETQCDELVFRMQYLVQEDCQGLREQIFDAGADTHTSNEYFLNSAERISYFFDKYAAEYFRNRSFEPFLALNKVGHGLHSQCPVFGTFSHDVRFYSLMAELGMQEPVLLQSMFLFKQPHFGDEVPWHQDATFLYTEPSSVIGLWFALKDAEAANGCLWAVPGGHRGPLRSRFVKRGGRCIFETLQELPWEEEKAVPLEAPKGAIVILHGHLPHMSCQNRSDQARHAYSLHFIDKTCRYPSDNWLPLSGRVFTERTISNFL